MIVPTFHTVVVVDTQRFGLRTKPFVNADKIGGGTMEGSR